MGGWGDILIELQQGTPKGGQPPVDAVRRKYLVALADHTKRATILYASKWTQPGTGLPPDITAIVDEDLQGLMAVLQGIRNPNLDLILHSPGGSIEAAEGIVTYLRSKFSNIRVIVPQQAMSAAAMICCCADWIIMGKHSFLGPTDPQLILNTPLGVRSIPAQAVIQQFELAQQRCHDPENLGAWLPQLGQFGPDLLVTSHDVTDLSKILVQEWLEKYMFKRDAKRKRKQKSINIANWLADHKQHKTHGRHISRATLGRRGLKIIPLERDPVLQDLALSVFHATTHTFMMSPIVKITESDKGKAFIKIAQQQIMMPMPVGVPMQQPQPQPQPRPESSRIIIPPSAP